MNECFGKNFILNGEIMPAETFDPALVYEGESVYEVIRMIKGYPVFFADHMERLEASVKQQHKIPLADSMQLKNDIIRLGKSDRKKETNLKIVFNYEKGVNNYLLYFIEPIYPSAYQYRSGVKGILFNAERKDPESKVINLKLRSDIYHKLILESGYEALLVNNENCITEGSRSNVFFISGNTLYTAPDKTVLNGITRKYIIEICRENAIEISYKCVNADEISRFDGVFMTGTSPVVLPFCCIGDRHFSVDHPVIRQLRDLYMSKALQSIAVFRQPGLI
jgi:branched-chain amino acid aminotransferase